SGRPDRGALFCRPLLFYCGSERFPCRQRAYRPAYIGSNNQLFLNERGPHRFLLRRPILPANPQYFVGFKPQRHKGHKEELNLLCVLCVFVVYSSLHELYNLWADEMLLWGYEEEGFISQISF